MVNDSADVTSSGRSFHVCGPATKKARLPTVDSLLVGTTRRLVPTERSYRRLGMAGDTRERAEVPRCKSSSRSPSLHVKFTCQDSDLGLDSLRDALPMEAGQRVGDVVGSPQVIGQPRSRVQH